MKKTIMLVVALFLACGPAFTQDASNVYDSNRVFFQELSRLAFQGYGDIDYWSKQAKLIAFRSAVHLTSSAIDINADRDHGAARIGKFKQIVTMNKAMIQTAQVFAFQGYGDTDYWSKRTKQFATELAMHTASLCGMCDAKMLKAVLPKVKTLLTDAQNAGFSGYGDVDYWSRRCKEFATRVIALLGEINTDLATVIAE